jgi:hypothetical protein
VAAYTTDTSHDEAAWQSHVLHSQDNFFAPTSGALATASSTASLGVVKAVDILRREAEGLQLISPENFLEKYPCLEPESVGKHKHRSSTMCKVA